MITENRDQAISNLYAKYSQQKLWKNLGLIPIALVLCAFGPANLTCDEPSVLDRLKAYVDQNPSRGANGAEIAEEMKSQEFYLDDGDFRAQQAAVIIAKGKKLLEHQVSISAIRFRQKDTASGAVVCVAQANFSYEAISELASRQVGYVVERTTDGGSFVSVVDSDAP